MAQMKLWTDGEKIPDHELKRLFRQPPLIPAEFHRSALLIGVRGAGKTTLLRYLKETHDGLGIHLALNAELASLSKQSALGPLALTSDAPYEELLGNKATSLLATSIAERAFKKRVSIPLEPFRECLPRKLLGRRKKVNQQLFSYLKVQLSRAEIDDFSEIPKTRPLPAFISELARESLTSIGPLLLLLDKADIVIPAALLPVFEILDQSAGYVALVASRPGHGGETLARLLGAINPGDHYDIFYLGLHPESREWRDFVFAAARAQPGIKNITSLDRVTKEGIVALARDSVRIAIEAFARVQSRANPQDLSALPEDIDDIKENQIVAIQTVLREYHHDFRRLLDLIRERAIERYKEIVGPVLVAIQPKRNTSLFDRHTALMSFLEAGLRSAAFSMPPGEQWVPGAIFSRVVLPPYLIWQKNDPVWYGDKFKSLSVTLSEGELFRSAGGTPPEPTIFVAYRLNFERSIEFRKRLESALSKHQTIRCLVEDGTVEIGSKWAPEIRRRIKRARLIVADIEGLRPEVLFELGFAHGLRRRVLPVVTEFDSRKIPYWLRATQLGNYGNTSGIARIMSSIESYLSQPPKQKNSPAPVARMAVWYRNLSWNEHALEQVRLAAERSAIHFEAYEESDSEEDILQRSSVAGLLFVSLDGTSPDSFSHFLCGSALAKPFSGYGEKRVDRRIVVLEPPDRKRMEFAAESLSRCNENVVLLKADQALEEFKKYERTLVRFESDSEF